MLFLCKNILATLSKMTIAADKITEMSNAKLTISPCACNVILDLRLTMR